MGRRVLGITLLLAALLGVLLSLGGIVVGRRAIDAAVVALEEALTLTSESLDNLSDTLILARRTVSEVNSVVDTIQLTADDLAKTIDDTQPLFEQVSTVVSKDIPDGLEAVQDALPALEQAAETIDTTLRTLSRFRIQQNILGFQIDWDLGIDYDPEIPFDVAVQEISSSLDGLPEGLRSLETDLRQSSENLDVISQDMTKLAEDVAAINDRITELDPILEEYIRIVTEVNDKTRQTRQQVSEQAIAVRRVVTILFVWIGLTQLAPLYLGYELLSGKRDPDRYVTRTELEDLGLWPETDSRTASEEEKPQDTPAEQSFADGPVAESPDEALPGEAER